MEKYVKVFNDNYNAKDLLKFFKNDFSAPLSLIDKGGSCSKHFGFRDYVILFNNEKITICEYNSIANDFATIFEINTTHFNTWGDFQKYLQRL